MLISRNGDRLVLEPVSPKTLGEVLESLEALPKSERLPKLDDPIPETVEFG